MTRPGRRMRYGVRLVQTNVYLPPTLKQALEREALSRNVRDSDHDEWTLSRVVVDLVASALGVSLEERG